MLVVQPRGAARLYFDHITFFDGLPDAALVDVHTIAALAKRSRASLWRDVQSGRLPPPVAIGPKTRRWRVADVRAYLKGGAA
jgi:predicted DNA-binding transcriptional regulator AlpA